MKNVFKVATIVMGVMAAISGIVAGIMYVVNWVRAERLKKEMMEELDFVRETILNQAGAR